MKACDIARLIEKHGASASLWDVFNTYGKKYRCPKCNTQGGTTEYYNAYPSGLPDSGFVQDMQPKFVECDLCEGHGYTEIEYKPKLKTEVVGYEKAGIDLRVRNDEK
jgi:hypothetical protein